MPNRLIQLLSDNRRRFTPIEQRVVRAADDSDEATIYLYDPIVDGRDMAEWWGGVCPQDFVPALHGITASTIHLRVKCGGGDVFAAEAMAQAMREHSSKIVAHIDGLAASAATRLCCAADEVIISQSSQYMIHKAWTFAIGNEDELVHTAGLLRSIDESIVDEYETRTSVARQQLIDWCKAETWFNAEQSVKHRFADSIAEPAKAKTKAAAGASSTAGAWNLRAYQHAPTNAIEAAEQAAAAEERARIAADQADQAERAGAIAERTAQSARLQQATARRTKLLAALIA